MKFINVLPFAALSAAFVIPDEEVISQVAIESHQAPQSGLDKVRIKNEVVTEFENKFSKLIDTSKGAFDHALDSVSETADEAYNKIHKTAFDAESWFESAAIKVDDLGKHSDHQYHGHPKPNQTVSSQTPLTLLSERKLSPVSPTGI